MEEEKRVTANDYFIVCKRCLNCFLNNKLAKVHKCENNQNFNEVENLYLLDLIQTNIKTKMEEWFGTMKKNNYSESELKSSGSELYSK